MNAINNETKPKNWLTANSTRKLIKRTLFGFVGGLFLSYIIFFVMITQMNYSLIRATWIASILSVILTLGLAFSQQVQCITLLTLPQFFSKRGRALLMAYIFVITLSGPMKNATRNTEVLSASLTCGQEQLKSAFREIVDIIKRPFVAIKHAVKHILKSIERVLVKVRKIMLRIKYLLKKILKTIRNAFKWLANIVNVCNRRVGTPYQRCRLTFEVAIDDCRIKLGWFEPLCNITYLAKTICYSVKFLDYMCVLVDFVSDSIVGVVLDRMEMFSEEIHKIFYVSIKFQHKFHFETNTSKTLTEIKHDIMADVRERSQTFLMVVSWIQFVAGLFFLWMIAKVMHYRSRFLTDNRFDNFYLNREFYAINERRIAMGKESALPLTWMEQRKFIPLTSCRLIKSERIRVARSVAFLTISTVQILCMLLLDYSLHWLLALIQYYGRKHAGLETKPLMNVSVSGHGMIADLYKNIIEVFKPFEHQYYIDPTPCLPNPFPPNFDIYFKICFYLFLSWTLAIFQPYGLRLRQIIMNRFYPSAARIRAAWLCNHLIRRRESFVKFARRRARRKFFKDTSVEYVSCLNYLRAKFNHFWIFRKLLGRGYEHYCMLCGMAFERIDDADVVKACVQWNCSARYCVNCFDQLDGSCAICMKPVDYGDMSDISEEMGSSTDNDDEKEAVADGENVEKKYLIVRDPDNVLCKYKFEIIDESKNK